MCMNAQRQKVTLLQLNSSLEEVLQPPAFLICIVVAKGLHEAHKTHCPDWAMGQSVIPKLPVVPFGELRYMTRFWFNRSDQQETKYSKT